MAKLSEQVCDSIRNDIISGRLGARTFLIESEVAERFGVSRAPVRDALHRLCDQGYLVSYPRKGYMVNMHSREEVNKLQEIRLQLEKLSVRLAIETASDAEILSLRELAKGSEQTTDPDNTENSRFHLRLAEISHNEFIPQVLRDLIVKATIPLLNQKIDLDKHNSIIDAMLERDLEKAYRCLEADIHKI